MTESYIQLSESDFRKFLENYKPVNGENIRVDVKLNCGRPSCNQTYTQIFERESLLLKQADLRAGRDIGLGQLCSSCFLGTKE